MSSSMNSVALLREQIHATYQEYINAILNIDFDIKQNNISRDDELIEEFYKIGVENLQILLDSKFETDAEVLKQMLARLRENIDKSVDLEYKIRAKFKI